MRGRTWVSTIGTIPSVSPVVSGHVDIRVQHLTLQQSHPIDAKQLSLSLNWNLGLDSIVSWSHILFGAAGESCVRLQRPTTTARIVNCLGPQLMVACRVHVFVSRRCSRKEQ